MPERHDPSAALFAVVCAMFPANCGVAAVFRATQVSPLRLAVASCGVATVIRATQVSPLRFGGGILRRCVGIPGDTSVAPRRCVGIPGDTSVAPTFWRRYPAALRRFSGRHKCLPYAAGCSSTALRRVIRVTRVAPRRCGVCGGRVVSRLAETVSRTVFPVAVTVFPVSRPAPLVTASVNVRGLMDFGGGEETFCSTKLD